MTAKEPVIVRELPEVRSRLRRKSFLADIKEVAENSYRPRLIVDMSKAKEIEPDSIDLLLECVAAMEHADGRVAVAAASPEAEVILELTRLNSVVDMFPSVSEATSPASWRSSAF